MRQPLRTLSCGENRLLDDWIVCTWVSENINETLDTCSCVILCAIRFYHGITPVPSALYSHVFVVQGYLSWRWNVSSLPGIDFNLKCVSVFKALAIKASFSVAAGLLVCNYLQLYFHLMDILQSCLGTLMRNLQQERGRQSYMYCTNFSIRHFYKQGNITISL